VGEEKKQRDKAPLFLSHEESKRGVSPSSNEFSPFPLLREGGQGDRLQNYLLRYLEKIIVV